MRKIFQNIGLTEKESQTFLRLLELGAQPVSVLAKNMGMPRTSMYLVMERLQEVGLLESFERRGIKYVKSIPAKNITDVLEDQKDQIESTKKMLEKKLPELELLENKQSLTPIIKIYEGKEAAMKMYKKILKEKEFCAFFHPELVKKHMPEYHFKIPETIKKNKVKARELLIECDDAKEYKKLYESANHQIKILPKNYFFASDTIICPDRVSIISSVRLRN